MKIHNKNLLSVKKLMLISLFFSLFFNCTVTEKPEFISLENIEVVDSNIETITLSVDANFINPNDVGGTLKTDNMKVYINGTEVANFETKNFEVPSNKNFTIPLKVAVATDSIINNKNIGGLLGSLISQRLKVRFKGEIDYKVFGYSSSYSVDKTQNIKVKL
jgi:LEA14-like dessication related protein